MKFDILLEKLVANLKNGDADFGYDHGDENDAYSEKGVNKIQKAINKTKPADSFGYDHEDDSDAYSKGGYEKAAKDVDKYVKDVEEKEYNQYRQPKYRAMITRGLNMPHFTVETPIGKDTKSIPMIKYSGVFGIDDLTNIQEITKKMVKSASDIFRLVDEPWRSLVLEGCVAGMYYGMVKEKITNANVLHKLAHDGGARVLEGLEIEGEHKALTSLCSMLDIPWAYDKDLTTVNVLKDAYDLMIELIGMQIGS